MKNLLDLGFWLVPPGMGTVQQTNNPPVAVDDALSVPRTSGPVTVVVLDNDFDIEGGPLTLISANAIFGTAVANPDGTVTYTPPDNIPPGQVQFDTVVYEIADPLDQRDTAQINVTIEGPDLQVNATSENTIEVLADSAPIDITVTAPPEFAGTYSPDVADLATGPLNLAPTEISGTLDVGAELTAANGLWIHDVAAEPVTQTWQWQRNGVDIVGETSNSYVLLASDVSQDIRVVETLSDAQGTRSVPSATIVPGFTPVNDATLIGWWDAAAATTITTSDGTAVTQWDDQAGTAHLTQSNVVWRPATGTRLLNGRNVLDFNGGSRHMLSSIALPVSGDFAIHMALVIDSLSSAFAAVLAIDAANDFQIDANNGSQFDGRLNAAGIGTTTTLSGGPFSGPLVLSVVFDRTGANQAEVFFGNVSRGVMALTAAVDASAAFHLMTNRSKNAAITGAVAEVILTGDVANRADHHAYLSTKWGIS